MEFLLAPLFLSFVVTCVIIESTPGPNMAYLAVLSATEGRKAGFSATLGVALGLLIVGIAAALGVATLVANSPIAYQGLRIGGIVYLLWLAWEGWRPETDIASEKTTNFWGHGKFFTRGLVVNLLNPKAAVFYIAILPRFVSGSTNVSTEAVILTVIYVAIATVIHVLIVTLAGTARNFLENTRRRFILRRILSLALVAIAIWFAVSTGQSGFKLQ